MISRKNQAIALIFPVFFITNFLLADTTNSTQETLPPPYLKRQSEKKISEKATGKIIDFALYNYDNLIADYYENRNVYQLQLARLITESTPYSLQEAVDLLNDDSLNDEANPVFYMLKLNRALKAATGYYFVDD